MFRSIILASVSVVLHSSPALSSTIGGHFSGLFSTPNGQTDDTFVSEGGGTNELRWGAPSGPSDEVETGNASSLSIEDRQLDFGDWTTGETRLGSIGWVNQSNWHSGGTWDSSMTLNFAFDTPGGQAARSIDINFSVFNSIDLSADTNENETTGSVADEIRGFSSLDSEFSAPLSLGSNLSMTDIVFRLDSAGSPGTGWNDETGFYNNGIASASRYDSGQGLWENREGGTSTIGVYGVISSVPLPAGFWMLLTGAIALLKIRRMQLRPTAKTKLSTPTAQVSFQSAQAT